MYKTILHLILFLLISIFSFGQKIKIAPAAKDKLYGYIDITGKWIIQPKYKNASEFYGGAAIVNISQGNYKIINREGSTMKELLFDSLLSYSQGIVKYKVDSLIGYYDALIGKNTKAIFSEAEDFKNGIAMVRLPSGEYGYLKYDNNVIGWLIQPTYFYATKFNEGIAYVAKDTLPEKKNPKKNLAYFFIDVMERSLRLPEEIFPETGFYNGKAVVRNSLGADEYTLRGHINTNGILQGKFKYRNVDNFYNKDIAFVEYLADDQLYFGFIDSKGKALKLKFIVQNINPSKPENFRTYTGFHQFKENLQAIRDYSSNSKKMGIINTKGKWIIPADKYAFISDFQNGLAVFSTKGTAKYGPEELPSEMMEDGQFGFMDKFGKVFIQDKYIKLSFFNNGYARFYDGSKWGCLDTAGNEVIPAEFDYIGRFVDSPILNR